MAKEDMAYMEDSIYLKTLMNRFQGLKESMSFIKMMYNLIKELACFLRNMQAGRQLLYFAEKMTKDLGGAKNIFKRED